MNTNTTGIHHITCISGDAQQNVDFYVGVLGMRMVKKSVNQDATDTYHLFYADAVGTPGTDLTFFPWPEMGPNIPGAGSVADISLAIPAGSLEYWQQRLAEHGVATGEIELRFTEKTLPFTDPHGLAMTLVEITGERSFAPWPQSPVPAEYQVRGMHSVRLLERELAPTQQLLELMGFAAVGEENGWHRFRVENGDSGQILDVQELPEQQRGRVGVGGVHHVAWRTDDVEHEMALRAKVQSSGLRPTTLIDRFWFESVYFREPGGVLFELATDGPGFAVDEEVERLGEALVLPPWLEGQRDQIEAGLVPLQTPSASGEVTS